MKRCPHCKKPMPPTHFACEVGKLGGAASSPAKTKAARENAKLGGWPKGRKRPARAGNPQRGGRPARKKA